MLAVSLFGFRVRTHSRQQRQHFKPPECTTWQNATTTYKFRCEIPAGATDVLDHRQHPIAHNQAWVGDIGCHLGCSRRPRVSPAHAQTDENLLASYRGCPRWQQLICTQTRLTRGQLSRQPHTNTGLETEGIIHELSLSGARFARGLYMHRLHNVTKHHNNTCGRTTR